MHQFLANPIVHGVVSGILAAAAVDVHAFLRWKSADEARTYGWGLAALRWAQGALAGGLAAAGLGALVG